MTSALQLFKDYHPVRGGIVTTMDDLMHAAPEYHWHVLSCGEAFRTRRGNRNGVDVTAVGSFGRLLSLPLAPAYPLYAGRALRRADLAIHHHPFPLADPVLPLFLRKDAALVVYWHADIVRQRLTRHFFAPFIRRTLERADRIIVSTEGHIDRSRWLPAYRDKCRVIPFGVDESEWHPLGDERADIEQFRTAHPRAFVFVGRLVGYKGIRTLLEALQQAPDAELFLVGDGPMRGEVERALARDDFGGRLHWFGRVDDRTRRVLLNGCRALVLPSISNAETFGIVQLEAMACGRPVINTSVNASVAGVARDGREALTVPPEDAGELAGAMGRLSTDDELAGRLGDHALNRVRENFTRAGYMARIREVYEEALRARGTAGPSTGQKPPQ